MAETRQVMKKQRLEGYPNEMLCSKTTHSAKEHMYPRTTWDIPRFWEKPNFAFLRVPKWVNEREEGEDVTDEQFTEWGLHQRCPLEGWMFPSEGERLKREVTSPAIKMYRAQIGIAWRVQLARHISRRRI